MAAMTCDVILDRIRAVCAGPLFRFSEALTWVSFDLQPETNIDSVFRVIPPYSQATFGEMDYVEDRIDVVQIWLARKMNQDADAVRRALLQDMHALTAAIVRDAHEDSGEYLIPDGGRGHAIVYDAGKDYAALRLTLPVRYEAQL
jgi:hypothetical protein